MGRPYADELAELSDTYRQALEDSIDGLTGFVNGSLRSPLRVVGSGGSATACIFASILHEQSTYMVSRHATPLEQLDACSSPGTSVLLISAGGNNKDIIAAFERASSLDRNALGILCSSGGRGKLSRMCASYPSVYVQDADIRNKDGFLATNSLLAACVWLARAYAPYVKGCLPLDIGALLWGSSAVRMRGGRICGVQNGLLDMMSDVSTIVVLHDAAGKPAAADLESKLVESGVRNVQPADYRNFAHGRHNWIGKHPQDTGVIMLTSLRCKRLAESTAGLLPPGIPVVRLNTELDGYAGMLSLLIQGMCAVGELGTQSGIDPGRPGVAEFGRKLYGMGPYG